MGSWLSIVAGRARLVRTMLTEVFVLALVAGSISLYVAFQAPRLLANVFSTSAMPMYQMTPDSHVIIYLGVTILASAILAGLVPAGGSPKAGLTTAIRSGAADRDGGGGRQGVLVGMQIAMSVVLMVCAGLYVRAWLTVLKAD